jgi:hypothetical protein
MRCCETQDLRVTGMTWTSCGSIVVLSPSFHSPVVSVSTRRMAFLFRLASIHSGRALAIQSDRLDECGRARLQG